GFLRVIIGGRLGDEELAELTELIDKKFILGIEEFCLKAGIDGEAARILCEMPNLYGDFSVAQQMKDRSLSPESAAAIDNLLDVYAAVKDYGYEKYISVDLGLVRSFKYYTGIVFKGITYGVAFPVCGGGRYDSLTERFGPKLSATGTAIWTDRLMTAIIRQQQPKTAPSTDVLVWYNNKEDRASAYSIARREREKGLRVICEEHDFSGGDEAAKYIAERKIDTAVKAEKGAL
ncbi:MAG: ATP phosphoribosyltransferase regulatory subunit, partial [Clostridia bacterium]